MTKIFQISGDDMQNITEKTLKLKNLIKTHEAKTTNYLVWFDLFMNDFFAIPKEEVLPQFINNLKNEGVTFFEATAFSHIQAIEQIFPKNTRSTTYH